MFRKGRNRAMNNVFAKYGLPKNMADKEIKQRVKLHNWVVGKLVKRGFRAVIDTRMNKLTKFLMNDTVFTEKKRKDIVDLAIHQSNGPAGSRHDDNAILALRSPVVISYLMELAYLFREFQIRQFTVQIKAGGRFREDAAMVSVLKKRIHFLRRLKRRAGGRENVGLVTIPTNLKEKYNLPNERSGPNEIKKILDSIFPLPRNNREWNSVAPPSPSPSSPRGSRTRAPPRSSPRRLR